MFARVRIPAVHLYRTPMLTDAQKLQIRTIHQQLKCQLPGYQPRPAQNKLIAEIASIIAGHYDRHDRIGLIEAGTGTGKSLAYILGTLPYALSQKKNRDHRHSNSGLARAISYQGFAFLSSA